MENKKHDFILKIGVPNQKERLDFYFTNEKVFPFLSKMIPLYNDWFETHYDKAKPEFWHFKEKLNDYFRKIYLINPLEQDFINWFISKYLGGFKMQLSGEVVNDIIVSAKLNLNFYDTLKKVTPTLIEQHLHEYCIWEKEQQDKIKNKLLGTPQPETKKVELEKYNGYFFSNLENNPPEKLKYFLFQQFYKSNAENVSAFLFALHELKYFPKPNNLNQTQLHEDLKIRFNVGFTRQTLNNQINSFNQSNKESLIKKVKTELETVLANK